MKIPLIGAPTKLAHTQKIHVHRLLNKISIKHTQFCKNGFTLQDLAWEQSSDIPEVNYMYTLH
jgi:hypothetical protein